MVNGSLDLITASTQKQMPRRRFLKFLAASSAVAMSVPNIASASIAKQKSISRTIAFNNLHTDEKISLTYFENGRYITDALREIDNVLRDHRTDEVRSMDPNLLNYLYELQSALDTKKSIDIISGYRSPTSNKELRSKSGGVAKHSKHMLGKAIDIRIEGINPRNIRDAAISIRQGGVGYYARSQFIHLDTGSIRNW